MGQFAKYSHRRGRSVELKEVWGLPLFYFMWIWMFCRINVGEKSLNILVFVSSSLLGSEYRRPKTVGCIWIWPNFNHGVLCILRPITTNTIKWFNPEVSCFSFTPFASLKMQSSLTCIHTSSRIREERNLRRQLRQSCLGAV